MAEVSLSSRVYNELLGRILSGRMRPGDVFNRRQVAAELNVSVAPVLEAMLELEAEGLIETLPRRGTRVRRPSPDDIWGQLVVREALECQAARLYHGEPVRRHLPRLQRLAEQLDQLDPRSVEFVREEIRFHHYLVSLADCAPLTAAFERVMKLGLLHAAAVSLTADGPPDAERGHLALVEALKSDDPDVAEAAVRHHVCVERPVASADAAPVPQDGVVPARPVWLGGEE
jgi:DNA-binding GntR family transcriptional regulator